MSLLSSYNLSLKVCCVITSPVEYVCATHACSGGEEEQKGPAITPVSNVHKNLLKSASISH